MRGPEAEYFVTYDVAYDKGDEFILVLCGDRWKFTEEIDDRPYVSAYVLTNGYVKLVYCYGGEDFAKATTHMTLTKEKAKRFAASFIDDFEEP
jgi:hypothetical protein